MVTRLLIFFAICNLVVGQDGGGGSTSEGM